jgi:hypothetical protein
LSQSTEYWGRFFIFWGVFLDRGYFKCWRKLFDSQVFQNEGLLKVWIWCLGKASYRERCIGFETGKGGVEVFIKPGQFVFGRDSAAKELRMNPSSVWKRINKLKNLGNCDIESNRQYSIISITNWSIYQGDFLESNSESNYQVTGKEQASNTNKKDKKVNKEIYSPDFLEFYKAYPRKVDKFGAWKAWEKCNGDRPEISRLLLLIEKLKNTDDWRKESGKYIPHPTTWINKKRWDDELDNEKYTNGKPIITG